MYQIESGPAESVNSLGLVRHAKKLLWGKLTSQHRSMRRFVLVSLMTGTRHDLLHVLPWSKRGPGSSKQRNRRRRPQG
jgi:hypothetical protein